MTCAAPCVTRIWRLSNVFPVWARNRLSAWRSRSAGGETAAAPAPTEDTVASEVSAALVGLGWSEAQAAKAIEKLAGSGLGASDMLRAALVSLGGGRG